MASSLKNPNYWVFFETSKSRRLFTETVDNCRQTETNILLKHWLSATGRIV